MRVPLLLYLMIGVQLLCSSVLYGQGGETTSSAVLNPLTIPYNGSGTTIGAVNDADDATVGGTSIYDNGPDWYYYFCATNSTPIYATINFSAGGASNPLSPSLSIIDATGGVIAVAQAVNPNAATLSINFTPTSGNCYYLIVDNGNSGGLGYTLDINNNVIANQLPGATIVGATSVCMNSPSPTLTFNGTNSVGPYTFTYTINGGPYQTIVSAGSSATVSCPTSTAGIFTYNLVSVSSVDGFSIVTSNAQSIEVLAPLVASISGTTNACQYSAAPNITFTGANGVPPYTFTYKINGGATQNVTSVGNSVTVSCPTNSVGMYTYILMNISSSMGCSQSQSGNATITVLPRPFYFANGSTTVCQNATPPTITFFGSGASAPYTFTYTINGGPTQSITSIGNTATLTCPTSALGSFVYTITSATSANGCSYSGSSSATVTVVGGNPTASVSVSNSPCIVNSFPTPSVTFTGSGCSGSYTFTYTVNNGPTQTVSTAGNSYNVTIPCPTNIPGDYTYTLWGVTCATPCGSGNGGGGGGSGGGGGGSSGGDPDNPAVPISTATVSIIPGIPNLACVDVTYNGSTFGYSLTVCQNSTPPQINFYSTTPPGMLPATDYSYTVSGPNGTVNATTNVFSPPVTCPTSITGTYTYNNVVVNGPGWTGNSFCAIIVHVVPLPTATVAGTTAVCQNSPAAPVTFNAVGGSGPYTFTYTINGGSNQTIMSNTSTVTLYCPTNLVGTYTYSLVSITNGNYCTQNQSGAATITVSSKPTASISGSAIVCQNHTAPIITFTGANAIDPYTFTYNINGGPSQTVTSVGNSATVTCPTPNTGTFTYNLLSVSSFNGCWQNQSGSAVITVSPSPTVTISGTTSVCQNASPPAITFIGANGTAPYTFTYKINGGADQTLVSAGNSVTITCPTDVSGVFSYELVSALSVNGCSQPQTGIATITVEPPPTATISGSMTVCENDIPPVITITGSNGSNPYLFTYSVDGGPDQTVNSIGNTAAITCSTSNLGAITFDLINVVSAIGCTQSQTGTTIITVNPLPHATISGSSIVCQNENEPVIVFTGSGGTAPYTFTYSINGGNPQSLISSGNTASLTCPTSSSGTFTYNLISVSDASASSCSNVQSDSVVIIVNPIPIATLTGITTACLNAIEPEILLVGSNGTAPYTFTYNIDNGASQTTTSVGNTSSVTCPTLQTGIVTYNVTAISDVNGCSNSSTEFIAVTVNPLPVILAGTDLNVCPDQAVTLSASGAGLNGIYVWDNEIQDNVSFIPPVSSPYIVSGTDQNGCSATDTLLISIYPIEPITFTSNFTQGCIPLNITLTNTTPNTTDCSWTLSNGTSFMGCGDQSVLLENPGCYSVTLSTYSQNGCLNSATLTDMICLELSPIAAFALSDDVVIINSSVNLTNLSQNATFYQWDFGDNAGSSAQTHPSYYYTDSGNYVILLEAFNDLGCSDTATMTITVEDDLLFYVPNSFTPDNNDVNDVFKPVFSKDVAFHSFSFLIYNRWGEVIFESHDKNAGWDGSFKGKPCQDGGYTWVVELTPLGKANSQQLNGHVILIR